MITKKQLAGRVLVAGVIIAGLGGVVFAAGQQGTESDPLVTLSYLNDKTTPDILAQVDTKLSDRESQLKTQLQSVESDLSKQVSDKVSENTAAGGTVTAAYSVVTLKAGQTLTAGAGCELLLRSGSAVCVASTAPGLVDMTGGATLAGGGALQVNHLYLATEGGHGVKASGAVTLMVRGDYQIA
ncbi:MAG: hypothetical protein LIO58_01520 [Oscillospiraceae bacterium]|nr:hypothetical protein [Oscillospiraceae bacterium]